MSFCSLSLYPSLKLYILLFSYEILTWGEPYPVEVQPQQERQCSKGDKELRLWSQAVLGSNPGSTTYQLYDLSLSFFICKMGIILKLTSWNC